MTTLPDRDSEPESIRRPVTAIDSRTDGIAGGK